LAEGFEEKAALRHPVFKPVDLPEFQIGDDTWATPNGFEPFCSS
jgi:hypothetical protein